MKRFILFAGIAILALAMGTTCMFFDEADVIEYDEFGRQVKTLTIITGDEPGPRNMHLATAQVAVNYYEVVFFDGTTYYRVAGPRGRKLTIRLPIGTPITGAATNAIAFAGYWDRDADDKTLLATGVVRTLNYGTTHTTTTENDITPVGGATPTQVQTYTENIRFVLVAVETVYNKGAAAANFKITAATFDGDPAPEYLTATTPSLNNMTTDRLNEQEIYDNANNKRVHPFWKLPKTEGVSTVVATYKLATAEATYNPGVYDGTGAATASGPGAVDHRAGVIASLAAGALFDSWAILTGDARDGVTAVTATNKTLVPTTGGIPETITIELKMMDEPVNQGFCMLLINIPVKALTWGTTAYDRGDLWTLRNGLYDHEIHDNNTDASLGGALLLCVGEPPSAQGKAIEIILSGPIGQLTP